MLIIKEFFLVGFYGTRFFLCCSRLKLALSVIVPDAYPTPARRAPANCLDHWQAPISQAPSLTSTHKMYHA